MVHAMVYKTMCRPVILENCFTWFLDKKIGCHIYFIKINEETKKKGVALQQRELLQGQMKKMKKNLFQTLVNKLFKYASLLLAFISITLSVSINTLYIVIVFGFCPKYERFINLKNSV